MTVAWNGNNIGGATKRAVGIAMHIGFANLAGVVASFTFRPRDAPRYVSGYGLLIGMVLMSLLLSFFMHGYLKRENARRDDEMRAKGLATLEFYTEDMKYAEREKGDDATVGHLFILFCGLVIKLFFFDSSSALLFNWK
jgi:hypothetical protein